MPYAAFKKYVLIDHANNRHVFVNSPSELNAWFTNYGINLSTYPTTVGDVPDNLVMLDVTTGQAVTLNLVLNAASFVIV